MDALIGREALGSGGLTQRRREDWPGGRTVARKAPELTGWMNMRTAIGCQLAPLGTGLDNEELRTAEEPRGHPAGPWPGRDEFGPLD